ncbi:hypothetical protein LCGC14_1757990 [marine sediment metagenome]|uniref:Uncharacterized protein n=1 Tax=marine sediment metagenome TaxID=412755 RepID=A0A0F9H1X8_9ZZZZ
MSGTKRNKFLLENLRLQRIAIVKAVTADSMPDFMVWSEIFKNAQILEKHIRVNPNLENFRKNEIDALKNLEPVIQKLDS